jgi:hypothetical protein
MENGFLFRERQTQTRIQHITITNMLPSKVPITIPVGDFFGISICDVCAAPVSVASGSVEAEEIMVELCGNVGIGVEVMRGCDVSVKADLAVPTKSDPLTTTTVIVVVDSGIATGVVCGARLNATGMRGPSGDGFVMEVTVACGAATDRRTNSKRSAVVDLIIL